MENDSVLKELQKEFGVAAVIVDSMRSRAGEIFVEDERGRYHEKATNRMKEIIKRIK